MHEILAFIRSEIERLGFTQSDALKIEVAVEEVVVNIISYGYKNEPSTHQATITIDCIPLPDEKGISVHIQDHGVPYNPIDSKHAKRSPISSSEEPVGGLGIFLVIKLMDSVNYKRDENSNIITIIKYAKNDDEMNQSTS